MAASRAREESGAVAIMVAISLTFLLVIAAMVLDFGIARLDRQTDKSLSDSAAMAGIAQMGVDVSQPKPWAGVCSAIAFAKAELNRQGFTAFTDTYSRQSGAGLPSNTCSDSNELTRVCTASTPSTMAKYVGTSTAASGGSVRLEIYGGYSLGSSGFPEESQYANLQSDQGASGGCDQLAVVVIHSRRPGLGSLATSSDIKTVMRSVGRIELGNEGKSPVALLILEQHDCASIQTNGNTTQLFVRGSGIRPGLMHSDSLGDGGNAGNCNSKKIVGGSGKIKAFRAPTGTATGVIGIRALRPGEAGAVSANAYDSPPAVEAEGAPGSLPEGRPLVTRSPVDERYLTAVTNRFSSAAGAWATVPGSAVTTCGGGTGLNTTISSSSVFFDCPSGLTIDSVRFTGADTRIVVNGPLTIKSGGTLDIPYGSELLVKGPGTSGANDVGFDNGGTLKLHTNDAASCAATDSATSGRAEFVLGSGFYKQTNSGAVLRMCHTFFGTMGNTSAMPTYTDPGPAPVDNSRNGYLTINGGTIDWSAPNAKPGIPSTSADWLNFEDLAFWTETSKESSIGGNGYMTLAGVFMLPNANPFSIGGTGGQSVENSQYVVRKLSANGGGTLTMSPDPNDAVLVKYFGTYVLVR